MYGSLTSRIAYKAQIDLFSYMYIFARAFTSIVVLYLSFKRLMIQIKDVI